MTMILMGEPNEVDAYTQEVTDFGVEVTKKWGAEPYWVAYAGGVPGMNADLPEDKYDEVKEWLTSLLGQPEELKRWHQSQRVGHPVLRFKFTPEMQHLKISHVNLIRMHTRKDKRFTALSWM